MEGPTAVATNQWTALNGAQTSTTSATPDVDDIEEAPSPQIPTELQDKDENHVEAFWGFVKEKEQHFRCVGLRLLGQFAIY